MKLVICAPRVRPDSVSKAALDADLIYVTEPLDQKDMITKMIPTAKILEDDDFCATNEEMESLVCQAKKWARSWHKQGDLGDQLWRHNVHCPELVMQSLTIGLLALLKPAHIYLKLLKKYPVKEMKIVGEGPWKDAAVFVGRIRNVSTDSHGLPHEMDRSIKKEISRSAKAALSGINHLIQRPRRGSILYSAASRYALPLLEKSGGYYLRDTFSLDMFRRSLRGAFAAILPEYFSDPKSSGQPINEAIEFFQHADDYFSSADFFNWEGEDLWPLFRDHLERLMQTELVAATQLVDRFHRMFGELSPRAVFVDEEVCLFNKALVQTANASCIPTFASVHGEPHEDIGSLPSSVSRILAWGPSTARRLTEWGIREDKITQVGAPQFAVLNSMDERAAVSRRFHIPPDAPLALFGAFAFSTNEHATFLRASYGVKLQAKSMGAALRAMERHPRLHLIVKFHPYESHAAFSEGLLKASPVHVQSRVRIVHNYPAAKLIAAADVVWTVLSTMYAETLPYKKPVLAFTDVEYPHPASGFQRSVNMEDPKECDAAIDACFDPAQREKILSLMNKSIADYFVDGNRSAVARTLNALEQTSALTPDTTSAAAPLVSVIMGVYNGGLFVSEQIQTILDQTHTNIELLVFDDGSTDGSLVKAEYFAARDSRVRVFRNAINKGLVANFLEGLTAARGEFIAFSDQDDRWRSNKLEALIQILNKSKDSQLVHSDMEVCDEDLKPIADSFWKIAGIRPKSGRLAERAVLRNLAPGCSMLFRREVKEAVCELVRREDFKELNSAVILDNTPFMHDHLVFTAAAALGRIAYTSERLLQYRQHGANMIGAFYQPNASKLSVADVLKRKLEILEKMEWAKRGLDLKRLRRYHAALDKGSVFKKLATLSDCLYLRT